MNRIYVFKTSAYLSKFFIVFGTIFTAFGIILLTKALINGFNTKFPAGDWNFVLFTFQGFLFIIMGLGNLFVRKYYIEWDENGLVFLLPDSKKKETIEFKEITFVTIRLFEIELKLSDKTRTIDLSNLQFEDLKRIKEKFEDLKRIKNE